MSGGVATSAKVSCSFKLQLTAVNFLSMEIKLNLKDNTARSAESLGHYSKCN